MLLGFVVLEVPKGPMMIGFAMPMFFYRSSSVPSVPMLLGFAVPMFFIVATLLGFSVPSVPMLLGFAVPMFFYCGHITGLFCNNRCPCCLALQCPWCPL